MSKERRSKIAVRGSSKWFSRRQEDKVAKAYGGVVSPSSGAHITDQGDVRVKSAGLLIECKHTGSFTRAAKSISVKVEDLEKIADEAWSESHMPVLALSIYNPHSVLADADGTINLICRLMTDVC